MSEIVASVSGGETSAYMAAMLKERRPDLICIFMNTGLEHQKTYEFLKRTNDFFDLKIICLEPVFNNEMGVSTSFKIVDIDNLYVGLKFFKEMVCKYGLMGPGFLHCTRELKQRPFNAYKRHLGTIGKSAIGIRYDEADRMSENFERDNLYYPLIEEKITKDDVVLAWENMPFRLDIPAYLGNCVTCWKKSDKKLYQIAREFPEKFQELAELEKINNKKGAGFMFRKYRNVQNILDESKTKSGDDLSLFGCKESCEAF